MDAVDSVSSESPVELANLASHRSDTPLLMLRKLLRDCGSLYLRKVSNLKRGGQWLMARARSRTESEFFPIE
jgi:hypothetical protein